MVEHVADADFPTEFGRFRLHAFRDGRGGEHLALEMKIKKKPALVRIHSKCTTGDVFHSLRCDCRQQLEISMKKIADEGGLLLYLDQEGRGIGLANKIRAYRLQDRGRDTVEANVELGFSEDERTYEIAAKMIKYFKLKNARVLTNNPNKIKELEKHGISVEPVRLPVRPTEFSRKYIESKRKKLGHNI